MATVDEKVIHRPYDVDEKKITFRIRINGVDHFQTRHKVTSSNSADHNALLDHAANTLATKIDIKDAGSDVQDYEAGNGDWASLPEGEDKQRRAQRAMRRVVELAREGKELQANGKTRPDAAQRYMSTRSLKEKIWDNLTGTHAEKAAYLAMTAGADSEYLTLRTYMDDLAANASMWADVVTWMSTVPNPNPVKTKMTV